LTNIVITGCSTGIGFATAKYLEEQGVKVYATVRALEDIKNLESLGLKNVLKLDVTQPDEIKSVIEHVLSKDEKIDI